MKKIYATLSLCLIALMTQAQVTTTTATWTAVGDVNLTIITSDADNTDGVADGALFVDGQSAVIGQGVTYTFGGTMTLNEVLNIKTYTYNPNVSYVSLKVELYNATDNTVLATSTFSISNSGSTPVLTTHNYTAVASDVGDVLQVRYIRTDNGNTARNFAIDNLSLNNTFLSLENTSCPFTVTPDLALTTSNASIDNEITTAFNRFSDVYLGTTAPTTAVLNTAIASYNALNISVTGGVISGNQITNFNQAAFLKTFAQHLKFNPSDTAIKEKANNLVWLVTQQFCAGTLAVDHVMYDFREFGRSAVLIKSSLNPNVQELFKYTLYKDSLDFQHFWSPTYDAAYQLTNSSINTDLIYNGADILMAFGTWFDTADERYRHMRGFKRYMDRFASYSFGTSDGMKKDGSGFHHWTAYDGYMYALQTASAVTYYLRDTNFKMDVSNYKILRDVAYAQIVIGNESGNKALAMSGRNPQSRGATYKQASVKRLAIAGGSILGLSTADPQLAGIYNRIWGVDAEFNYSSVTPLSNNAGYFQLNHSHAGVYRNNDWLAVTKGFSNNMWGSEIYSNRNRYGRYQSYGTLEIIYSGDLNTNNGFDVATWNWNYNPGATTIVLPWDKLHAERDRIDELQENRFAGSLAFKNKNSSLLKNTHGTWGMFAMDFKEKEGLGWGATHSSNNHNATFTFKKSTFTFDDFIICLASDINNNDATNPTVTTLYQRKNTNSNNVLVNNSTQNGTASYSDATDNWVISKFNTGFYMVSGGGDLNVWNGNQQVPSYSQTDQNIGSNPTASYSIGYINHGTNPSNKGYEYLVVPNANASSMTTIGTTISGGNKPYTVHQKNASAHIIEHVAKKAWGYSVFADNTAISNSGLITNVDKSSLMMYELDGSGNTMTFAIDNPDIGYNDRTYSPAIEKKIQVTFNGEWNLQNANSNVLIVSSNASNTVVEFTTNDGLPTETVFNKVIPADTTAPTAPTNAIAVNTTQTTTDLSWTASTDNVAVTAYDVYQGATVIATVSGTTRQVTGLTANTAYAFSVKAKDAAGNVSAASSVVNVTTLAIPDTTAPTAPTNLVATNTTQTTTDLSWTASTDNVAVTTYDVYQGATVITTVSGTTRQVTGLTANTAYAFSVKAKDAAGNVSAASSVVNVTTLAVPDTTAPTAPTNLVASNTTQTTTDLSWTASTDNVAVTTYDVYQGATVIATVSGTTRQVTGLTANTAYAFSVKAKDAAGNVSAASSVVNVTTLAVSDTTAPTAPTNLVASNTTQTTTDLSWTASTDNVAVSAYDVYQGASVIATVSGTTRQITGLTANTAYAFSVKAKDAAGNVSAASSVVNVTTLAVPDTTAPTAPTNLVASNTTQTTTDLSWTASTDNVAVTAYDVYQGATVIATVSGTTRQVTGLTANTAYSFTVKAKDAAGNVSAASSVVNVTTLINQVSYCALASTNSNDEYIGRVQIGTINNVSTGSFYTDFTSLSTVLAKGVSHSITVTPTWTGTTYSEGYSVWIDYNNDGDFTDAGEQIWTQAKTQTTSVNGSFTIPSGALESSTRMRIAMLYNAIPSSSCGSYQYGEVEDYTITIEAASPDTQAPTAPTNLVATNTTQTTTDLSWTASTDNVAVTAYDVYQGASVIATVSGTTRQVTGLTASTAYAFSVKAKDAAGNVSAASATLNVSTIANATCSDGIQNGDETGIDCGGSSCSPCSSSDTVLHQGFFESGWDGWSDGGSDCARYSGSHSYEGNYSIRIRDNSGTSSAMTSPTFNLSTYNEVEIKFYYKANSMENGEDFWLRFYNGSSWTTVKTWARGTDFSNGSFNSVTITLNASQYNLASNSQFRIQCDASGNNDQIYIDEVIITGKGSSGAARAINTNVNELIAPIENIIEKNDFTIYPNPVNGTILNIKLSKDVNTTYRIINMIGEIVSKGKTTKEIFVGNLEAGMYLIQVNDSKTIITKKFIKR